MDIIAITQRVDVIESYGERRDALDQRWSDFLEQCGLVPLILPNHRAAAAMLDRVNVLGAILSGGNDLADYGGGAPERDELENFLIERSMKTGMPLLGVCRGMQSIQNYFGVPLERVEGHVAVHHDLEYRGRRLEVNSYHNFGARETAPGLLTMATARDGVVEAIRHEKHPILGIMWHPERDNPFSRHDVELVEGHFAREKQ